MGPFVVLQIKNSLRRKNYLKPQRHIKENTILKKMGSCFE